MTAVRLSAPSVLVLSVLGLAACGQQPGTNAPTDPAEPIETAEASAPAPPPPPGAGSPQPGAGPASFVGRWAADVAWCAGPRGDRRPIEISTTRFDGYENSCAIAAIDQADDGYTAALVCQAEGQTTNERVHMAVQGEGMRLTWLNRNAPVVVLTRCPTPGDAPVS